MKVTGSLYRSSRVVLGLNVFIKQFKKKNKELEVTFYKIEWKSLPNVHTLWDGPCCDETELQRRPGASQGIAEVTLDVSIASLSTKGSCSTYKSNFP